MLRIRESVCPSVCPSSRPHALPFKSVPDSFLALLLIHKTLVQNLIIMMFLMSACLTIRSMSLFHGRRSPRASIINDCLLSLQSFLLKTFLISLMAKINEHRSRRELSLRQKDQEHSICLFSLSLSIHYLL